MSSKNCPRCGHASSDDALFCPRCGNSLKGAGADPLVGTVIADRYLLVEKIGGGNSGTIYRGEHTTLGKKVAVKVLHHELSTDEGALERFRREATTVGEIDNEHIVHVIDFGRASDGRLFFAQEFLDGETLSDVLKHEHRLPVPRVLDIVAQVGDALMEAHALGYIHRDLRPRNIMLTKKRGKPDFVKLLDFGLSKLVLPSDVKAGATSIISFADPRYMAPELLRGEAADRRSDLYSLAVITFEMLTGAPPYEGTTPAALLALTQGKLPSVRDKRPEVPEWLDRVLKTALASSPEQRFVTVLKMTEHLAAQTAPTEVAPAVIEKKAMVVEAKPAVMDAHVSVAAAAPKHIDPKATQIGMVSPFAQAKAPVAPVTAAVAVAVAVEGVVAKSAVAESKSAMQSTPVTPTPIMESKPAPVENRTPVDARATQPISPVQPQTVHVAQSQAALNAKPGQAGVPIDPYQGKKSKKRQRRENEARRSDQTPTGKTPEGGTSNVATLMMPTIAPAPVSPTPVGPVRAASASAVIAGSAQASGTSGTDRPQTGKMPVVGGSKVEVAADLSSVRTEPRRVGNDDARRVDVKRNGQEKRDSGRSAVLTVPNTGEHERVWFSDSAQVLKTSEDEHFEDADKKNRPLIIGLSSAGAVLVGVLAVAIFWPRAHKEETKERSYDEVAVVASHKEAEAKAAAAAAANPEPAPVPTPAAVAPVPVAPQEAPVVPAPAAVPVVAEKVAEEPPAAVAKEPEPAMPPPQPIAKPAVAAKPEPPKKAPPAPAPPAHPTVNAEAARQAAQSAELLVKQGHQKLDAGDNSAAVANFKKAKEIDPRSAAAMAGLGDAAFEQGDYGQAVSQYKQAVRLAPHKGAFQVSLGQAFYKSGNYTGAAEQCNKVLLADPSNQEAKHCAEAAQRKLTQ